MFDLEQAQPLDPWFGQLMEMPVDLEHVVDTTSGETATRFQEFNARCMAEREEELLAKHTPYEWMELSKEIAEIAQSAGLTMDNILDLAAKNEADEDTLDEDASDELDEQTLAFFERAMEANEAQYVLHSRATRHDQNLVRHFKAQITQLLIADHGETPLLREMDLGTLAARLRITPGMQQLAEELSEQSIAEVLWRASRDVRSQILYNAAFQFLSDPADAGLSAALVEQADFLDLEKSEYVDNEPFAVKFYLDDMLPIEGQRLSDFTKPGTIITQDDGIQVRIDTVSSDAIDTTIIGMPQGAYWPEIATGTKVRLRPTSQSNVFSTRAQLELPLSLQK
ncbi:MAG: hypothetical protein Greene101449_1016 [Candidatus Peregrinibacteria bacterium Greene1014_49]|nr:MAG: hypothetical protein Greene101449_1016 [Candidatus Peregrinibacteria bacterium Greene1014_49]